MKLSDYISLQEFFLSSYYPSLELSVTHCSQLQHLGLVQGLSLQITQRGTHSIGRISQFGSLPRLPIQIQIQIVKLLFRVVVRIRG